MAGALNAAALAPTVPPMNYYTDAGGGALSGAAPSYMPGVDPNLLALMNAAPGPESPYARRLSDASSALMGPPEQIAGALDASRSGYDKAVAGKMAAINRAMTLLQNTTRGQVNLPLMAAAAGALQPTRTGTIGEEIGNAAAGAIPAIERQRAIERELATSLGGMDVAGADTGISGALGDESFLEKRLGLADQMANQAGQVQGRADLTHSRLQTGVLGYAGRIGAADIASNRNRYQFIGNDPNDPATGRYLDKSTGQTVAGPAAGGKPGAQGAAEWKYQAWLKAHPGDEAGALDFVAGHKRMDPAEIHKFSRGEAQRELGQGADEADIAALAQKIEDSFASLTPNHGDAAAAIQGRLGPGETADVGGRTIGEPAAGGDAPPPPPAAATPPPPIASRVAGKTVWVAPDGVRYMWTGKGWKPQ